MKQNRASKEKILKEIEKLPEDHLKEVRDFVNNLIKAKRKLKEGRSIPDKDPIMKLFGIADVEPFSHKIGSDIY